nr:chitobiase/beta-hexosaminidase C-terminal domain-containing protein [Candidatus Cloacimonadota bacterium]
MKKGFTLMLLLFSFLLLSAFSMQDLADAPITPELVKEIQYRNSLVRGYGWSSGTPTALPTVPGTFLEDSTYEFDFAPYISLTGDTTLDSLYIAWSQSSFFTISKPDPANFPFKLLFTPTTPHFYGTRPVWVSLYQEVGGIYINPVSVGINVTVTNIPTDPDFFFPNINDPDAVSADYIFDTLEETPLILDFGNIVKIYDGNVGGTTPRNFELYITQTSFPNNIVFTQSTNNNGQVVTFTPNQDYFGTQYFIVTAVDKVAPYQWASTTFGINVINVNDDPVLDSFSPPSPLVLNQGESQTFNVVVSDVDMDVLSYTWTFSGVLNGVPFANVVSTTDSWTNEFINPGNFVLTLVVDDGNGGTITQVWQITVNPKGPQFDPEGDTFSTSVVNTTFGTQGVVLSVTGINNPELATIWFTTSSTNPTVPVYPVPQIYTQPIPITVPPQDYTYTITAWFTHPDYSESQHNTQAYVMTGVVETPVFTEAPGLIRSNERYPVHITCPTAGADIFYSYDGGPWTLYTIPIMVPAHTVATLRAYASKTNWVDSAVTADHVYDVRRYVVFNAPLMDTFPAPDGDGNYCVCLNDSVWVNFTGINTVPPEATIYYQIQAGIHVGADAIDPYSNPAPILVYDPLNPPDWSIFSTSTIVWWAEYTPSVGLPYLISDMHRYPIPVKNRTRMHFFANGTVFNPPAGTYTTPQSVYINTVTLPANAPIWYSLNGGAFILYNGGPIQITQTTTIETYAGEMPPTTTLPSLHQIAVYNITGTLPAPLIAPPGYPDVTVYDTDQAITLSMPVGDPRWAAASIYYTTDGTDPTVTSNLYGGPFTLIQGHWIVKAIAVLPDWVNSSIATKQYYIKFLTPVTFLPEATEHYNNINVEMHAYTGAEIRYTEDGSEPNPSSNLYSAPLPLAIDPNARYTRNYKAKAFIPGWLSVAAASKSYTMIPTVLNPFFNPADSIQATPIMVTIDCLTPGVTIYYTLDGSDPSPTNGTLFSGPFELSTTTTVRARAYKTDFRASEIVRMPYIIGNIIGALVFTPPAGTYDSAQNVSIIASPPNAQIYYTLDGSAPNPANPNTFLFDSATPIHLGLNSTTTINAIATLTNWQTSSGSATYVITGTLAVPDINPDVYEYAVGTVVSVSITAPMGAVWYRVNGGADQLYTGSFDITTNTTVEAWAVLADWISSPVVSATYTFNSNLTPPLITPISGIYNTHVQCVITTLQNAEIYYSTDGSIPSILYTQG